MILALRLPPPTAGSFFACISPDETIRCLTSFDGARLLLPKKFAPDTEFLKRHAEKRLKDGRPPVC
jgi:hypothetical protein